LENQKFDSWELLILQTLMILRNLETVKPQNPETSKPQKLDSLVTGNLIIMFPRNLKTLKT
jgi:hypothetical protein